LQLTSFAQAQRAVDEAIRLNRNLPGIYTLKGIIADYDWLPPRVELAAGCYRLHRSEGGAREKPIVERISEQVRQNKTKAKVISPVLPSP
jgi:hypothetical protein